MQTHYEFMEKLAGDYHKQKIEKEYGVLLRILAMADLALLDFENNSCDANYAQLYRIINFLFLENIIATNNDETRLPPILEQRVMAVKNKYFKLDSKMQMPAVMTDYELLASFIVFKNSQLRSIKNDDKRA